MNTAMIIGVLHLLTLGLGFGSLWGRARALRQLRDDSGLGAVFYADNLYGLAALLWIGTGLWRAFGGLAKGSDYYLNSSAFWVKMSLFGLVFALELLPMIRLVQWRLQLRKGQAPDLRQAPLLATLSFLEVPVLAGMVLAAYGMARGIWP